MQRTCFVRISTTAHEAGFGFQSRSPTLRRKAGERKVGVKARPSKGPGLVPFRFKCPN